MTQPQQQAPLQAEYLQFNPDYSIQRLNDILQQQAGVIAATLGAHIIKKAVDFMAGQDRVFLCQQNAEAVALSNMKFTQEQRQDYVVKIPLKSQDPQQQLWAEYKIFSPEYSVEYLYKGAERAGIPTLKLKREDLRKYVIMVIQQKQIYLCEQNPTAFSVSVRKFKQEGQQMYPVRLSVKSGQSL